MSYTCRHPSRRHAELPFEGNGKMRTVLEAHFIIHLRRLELPVAEHLVCLVQPFPDEPLLRREVAQLGEVALEGGEAAPGVGGKFLQGHVLRVVRLHEWQQDGGLSDAPHVRRQCRLVHTAEEVAQEAPLETDADSLVGCAVRRVFQQLHLMVAFEEHVTARADGQPPPLVLHHHFARDSISSGTKQLYTMSQWLYTCDSFNMTVLHSIVLRCKDKANDKNALLWRSRFYSR